MSAEPPPQPDAPGPGSDDFDPKQHLWDGTNWWSLDKQRWWDGSQWRSVAAPAGASAAPPPPPQVSPDGKFYWDGQRWVPIQAQAPSQSSPQVQAFPQQIPSGYEIKKKGHGLRNGLIGCLGIIALIFFIPFCAGLAGISTNSSNPSTTTGTSRSPGPSPAPRQAVTESGQGSKIITPFHLGQGNYKVTWTAQGHDNFIVHINLGDQSQHLVNEIPPTPSSGEVLFDSPQEADYILDVQASTLTWSITFTPI